MQLTKPALLAFAITLFPHVGFCQTPACSVVNGNPYRGVQPYSNSGAINSAGSCMQDVSGYPRCAKGLTPSYSTNPLPAGSCIYGLRYECVEYVKRFYSIRDDGPSNQIDTRDWAIENASDYLTLSPDGHSATPNVSGMKAFPNDGSGLPMQDDIIVFNELNSSGKRILPGHVAIATSSVDPTTCQISIIEQNFLNKQAAATLQLDSPCHSTNNPKVHTRAGLNGVIFPIEGWLRSISSNSPPPTSPAPTFSSLVTSPTPTIVGGFDIIVTNGTNIDPSSVFLYMIGPLGATNPQCTTTSSPYNCEVTNGYLNSKTTSAVTAPVNIVNQGYYDVFLQNGATGAPSLPWQLEVQAPVPSITALVPSSLPLYSTGQTININGNGFAPGAALTIGNQPHTDTYVNPNQMTMVTTLADVTAAGKFSVVVTNLPPGGGPSNGSDFTITTATPTMSVTPSSLSFGGQKIGSASTKQPVTVQNTGSGSLAVPSTSITGANASDFSASNGCSSSLSANASCQIQIGFTPSALGSRNATMTVTSAGAAGSPATVSLSGTGTANGVQITSTISPPSPITLGTPVLISGTASPGAVVTANESVNGGSPTPYVQKAADSAGNWTDGQFTPKVAGNYQEVFTDDKGDTEGSLQFTVTALPAPLIDHLTPMQLTPSDKDQPLTIVGTGFVSGLTVIPNYPGAGKLTGAQAVVSADGKSIAVKITVNGIGNWPLQVQNPDTQLSNTKTLVVQ